MAIVSILRNDWSLDATVTSTNEVADTRARARVLTNYRTSERWRTNGLATMRVTFDAGESLPWDTFYLGHHSGYETGTAQVTADDTLGNLFTTPDYDSGPLAIRLPSAGAFQDWHFWHHVISTQTHRYIGLEIVDDDNPDGFFSAAIAYIGNLWIPGLEAEMGDELGYDDTSIVIELANGEDVVRRRARKQTQRISWSHLSELDAVFHANLSRTYGRSTPIVIKKEPDSFDYSQNLISFCYVTQYGGPKRQAIRGSTTTDLLDSPRFQVQLSVREVQGR